MQDSTALMVASQNGFKEIVDRLLSAKVDVHHKNKVSTIVLSSVIWYQKV